jgi:hypothetical protein
MWAAMNAFFQTEPFENALRQALDYAALGGPEVAECLEAAGAVRDGDHESWHATWLGLAERVRRQGAGELAAGRKTSARDALLRAAGGYRTAGVFLEPNDPRTQTTGAASAACFATAMRLSGPLCEIVEIAQGDTRRVGYLHRAGCDDRPRATLLVAGGVDVTPLELYFACGVAATHHGWHCLCAGSGDEDTRELARALLGTAATLPSVDPACLAVAALTVSGPSGSSPRSSAVRRVARPLAMGSAGEIAAALRRGVTDPLVINDAETGDGFGALGRFHQRLSHWLLG